VSSAQAPVSAAESRAAGIDLAHRCGVAGVMCTRGLLENPARFGASAVPNACLMDFVRLAAAHDTPAKVSQHHLPLMLEHRLSPQERNVLAQQRSLAGSVLTLQAAGFLDEA